jgi:hypothetical protein
VCLCVCVRVVTRCTREHINLQQCSQCNEPQLRTRHRYAFNGPEAHPQPGILKLHTPPAREAFLQVYNQYSLRTQNDGFIHLKTTGNHKQLQISDGVCVCCGLSKHVINLSHEALRSLGSFTGADEGYLPGKGKLKHHDPRQVETSTLRQ